MKASTDVDDYIGRYPAKVQTFLRGMRDTIRKAAPKSTERISYKVPAFCIDGRVVVWYGAFTSHIGFYPGASAIAAFKKDLSAYKHAKGSVQFPYSQPLPLDLVTRMVRYRIEQGTRA